MNYSQKSFSVSMGGTKEYSDNWDRIFGKKWESLGSTRDGEQYQCPNGHEFATTDAPPKCPVCHEVWE